MHNHAHIFKPCHFCTHSYFITSSLVRQKKTNNFFCLFFWLQHVTLSTSFLKKKLMAHISGVKEQYIFSGTSGVYDWIEYISPHLKKKMSHIYFFLTSPKKNRLHNTHTLTYLCTHIYGHIFL